MHNLSKLVYKVLQCEKVLWKVARITLLSLFYIQFEKHLIFVYFLNCLKCLYYLSFLNYQNFRNFSYPPSFLAPWTFLTPDCPSQAGTKFLWLSPRSNPNFWGALAGPTSRKNQCKGGPAWKNFWWGRKLWPKKLVTQVDQWWKNSRGNSRVQKSGAL